MSVCIVIWIFFCCHDIFFRFYFATDFYLLVQCLTYNKNIFMYININSQPLVINPSVPIYMSLTIDLTNKTRIIYHKNYTDQFIHNLYLWHILNIFWMQSTFISPFNLHVFFRGQKQEYKVPVIFISCLKVFFPLCFFSGMFVYKGTYAGGLSMGHFYMEHYLRNLFLARAPFCL